MEVVALADAEAPLWKSTRAIACSCGAKG
jgi:hypothetical protein